MKHLMFIDKLADRSYDCNIQISKIVMIEITEGLESGTLDQEQS
jgi:hypothetical protein